MFGSQSCATGGRGRLERRTELVHAVRFLGVRVGEREPKGVDERADIRKVRFEAAGACRTRRPSHEVLVYPDIGAEVARVAAMRGIVLLESCLDRFQIGSALRVACLWRVE